MIDIILLLAKRSEEELSLLHEEKSNTLAYWANRKSILKQCINTLEQSSDQYSMGCIAFCMYNILSLCNIIMVYTYYDGIQMSVCMCHDVMRILLH